MVTSRSGHQHVRMPRLDPTLRPALARLAPVTSQQAGVCTLAQAGRAGLSDGAVRRLVESGRWTRVHRGVLLTQPGLPPPEARLWAAHLALGPDSVIAGRAAAWALGLLEAPPRADETILLMVPEPIQRRGPGLAQRRVRGLAARVHPVRQPRMLTVEFAVLDLVRLAPNDAAALDGVLRACRLRLTTPDRILTAAASLARVPRRGLVRDVCAEAAVGVASPLELRYHRDVALPHRLPAAARQVPGSTWQGRTAYRDLAYPGDVLVELDGRLGHERESEVFRDQLRDNAAAITGAATLRFGWHAVTAAPCTVAAQVSALLRLRGWTGSPRACAPGCLVAAPRAAA